jgi:hypothetical protein
LRWRASQDKDSAARHLIEFAHLAGAGDAGEEPDEVAAQNGEAPHGRGIVN